MNRLAVTLALVVACHHDVPSADELLASAGDVTREFFSTVEAGDCAKLAPILIHPEACAAMVEQFAATHSHFTKLDGTKLDGRDPHLVLVTVTAQSAKHTRTWIVRAKWTDDGWRFAL